MRFQFMYLPNHKPLTLEIRDLQFRKEKGGLGAGIYRSVYSDNPNESICKRDKRDISN